MGDMQRRDLHGQEIQVAGPRNQRRSKIRTATDPSVFDAGRKQGLIVASSTGPIPRPFAVVA
jgi:hypothetical protein